jgi:hypothetical protein
MHDPLDALLRPKPAPPPESLFPLTLLALRRARRRQRVAQVASLLAGAAAGLIALHALVPECPRPREAAPAAKAPAVAAPTATALEWRALEGPGPAAPAYRQAGDRYLDEGDPANAARCYGHALSEGGARELSESDSYLLMAIKLARKKERD